MLSVLGGLRVLGLFGLTQRKWLIGALAHVLQSTVQREAGLLPEL